jgi:hypothetical protein
LKGGRKIWSALPRPGQNLLDYRLVELPVRGTPRYAESRGAIDSWFPPEKRQEFYDRFDADARALAELPRKVGWTAAEERPRSGWTLQAVSWYLSSPLSYRDIEELVLERGLAVDHSTLNRWVRAYAPLIERRLRLGNIGSAHPLG